ncbi:hypothetical protein ACFOHY_23795 [Rhizobium rosettiformans]|uniref:hypothetical protein n=1 Tax=Rhizobium rosettiformans TaxID=1368430 RepID=UPI003621E213
MRPDQAVCHDLEPPLGAIFHTGRDTVHVGEHLRCDRLDWRSRDVQPALVQHDDTVGPLRGQHKIVQDDHDDAPLAGVSTAE